MNTITKKVSALLVFVLLLLGASCKGGGEHPPGHEGHDMHDDHGPDNQ